MTVGAPWNPETPCVGCGYDVRGLDEAGRCPECGTSIRRSLGGQRLANADPVWRAKIVRGQRLASLGLSMCVFGVVAILLEVFIGGLVAVAYDVYWGLGNKIVRSIVVVSILGGLITACVGFILVTTLDPRERERETWTSPRLLARWGLVVATVFVVLGELDGSPGTVAWTVVGTSFSMLGLAAIAIAVPAFFTRLTDLAERIPSPELTARTSGLALRLRKQLLGFLALAVVHEAAGLVPRGTKIHAVVNVIDGAAGCGLSLILILLLISLFSIFATMQKLARAFKAVVEQPADQVSPDSDDDAG